MDEAKKTMMEGMSEEAGDQEVIMIEDEEEREGTVTREPSSEGDYSIGMIEEREEDGEGEEDGKVGVGDVMNVDEPG